MIHRAALRLTASCYEITRRCAPATRHKLRALIELRYLRCPTLCVLYCFLSCLLPSLAQAPTPATAVPPGPDVSGQVPAAGGISGTVVDQDGNFLLAARVTLTRPELTGEQTQESDGVGHFVFTPVAAGPFELTVTGEGFATQQRQGVLHPGEVVAMEPISLPIAAATTEGRVSV